MEALRKGNDSTRKIEWHTQEKAQVFPKEERYPQFTLQCKTMKVHISIEEMLATYARAPTHQATYVPTGILILIIMSLLTAQMTSNILNNFRGREIFCQEH